MMDFLSESTSWILFSFIVFAVVVWRSGKQAFLNILDKRIESIREEIKTAENLRIEAQELLAQYQRKHRDAVKESEAIIANAQEHAKEIQKNADAELKETMKRREAQLKDRLARMEQSAITEIQKYAADLAIKATKEIITEHLDKKTNEKLVDSAIKDISKTIN